MFKNHDLLQTRSEKGSFWTCNHINYMWRCFLSIYAYKSHAIKTLNHSNKLTNERIKRALITQNWTLNNGKAMINHLHFIQDLITVHVSAPWAQNNPSQSYGNFMWSFSIISKTKGFYIITFFGLNTSPKGCRFKKPFTNWKPMAPFI